MEISDKKIVDGCRKGKARFQRILYDRYSPALFGICLRYTKNEMEAKDVLQDSFIRIFSKLEQYRGDGSFEGWLKRIAVTTALNYLTQTKRFRLMDDIESHSDSGALKVEDNDAFSQEDILRMIRELPVGYQTVFNLYEVEGYPHQEIANILNISESTSKTQLFQARRRLRKKIEKLFDEN